jgi:hypothetical protein
MGCSVATLFLYCEAHHESRALGSRARASSVTARSIFGRPLGLPLWSSEAPATNHGNGEQIFGAK